MTMTIEKAKLLAETAAFVAAALFFLYKALLGYLRCNLELSLRCERRERRTTEEGDILAVRVDVAKGDKAMLRLHDVSYSVTFTVDGSEQRREGQLPFIGRQRMMPGKQEKEAVQKVSWSETSEKAPLLNLAPGDRFSLSFFLIVPTSTPCLVVVALLGRRFGNRFGQWKSSIVSLPPEPQESGAGHGRVGSVSTAAGNEP